MGAHECKHNRATLVSSLGMPLASFETEFLIVCWPVGIRDPPFSASLQLRLKVCPLMFLTFYVDSGNRTEVLSLASKHCRPGHTPCFSFITSFAGALQDSDQYGCVTVTQFVHQNSKSVCLPPFPVMAICPALVWCAHHSFSCPGGNGHWHAAGWVDLSLACRMLPVVCCPSLAS